MSDTLTKCTLIKYTDQLNPTHEVITVDGDISTSVGVLATIVLSKGLTQCGEIKDCTSIENEVSKDITTEFKKVVRSKAESLLGCMLKDTDEWIGK